MRCAVCDADDDDIFYDPITKEFSICGECQEAVTECLESYDAEEDDESE